MSWESHYVDQAQQWRKVSRQAHMQGDEDLAVQARDNADAYARLANEETARRRERADRAPTTRPRWLIRVITQLGSRASNPGPRG